MPLGRETGAEASTRQRLGARRLVPATGTRPAGAIPPGAADEPEGAACSGGGSTAFGSRVRRQAAARAEAGNGEAPSGVDRPPPSPVGLKRPSEPGGVTAAIAEGLSSTSSAYLCGEILFSTAHTGETACRTLRNPLPRLIAVARPPLPPCALARLLRRAPHPGLGHLRSSHGYSARRSPRAGDLTSTAKIRSRPHQGCGRHPDAPENMVPSRPRSNFCPAMICAAVGAGPSAAAVDSKAVTCWAMARQAAVTLNCRFQIFGHT